MNDHGITNGKPIAYRIFTLLVFFLAQGPCIKDVYTKS